MPIAQAGGGANGNQAASIKAILHQAQGLSPTRRVNARDNAVLDHRQSPALRHGDCRPRLWLCRTDDAWRNYRRLAVRCHDDRRRRWLAPAHRERARGSLLPGPQDCGDRKQAARLMPFPHPPSAQCGWQTDAVCDGNGEGPGAAARGQEPPGPSRRGGNYFKRPQLFPDKSPLRPFFDPPFGDRREGGTVRNCAIPGREGKGRVVAVAPCVAPAREAHGR
jgi:hypothetical protein